MEISHYKSKTGKMSGSGTFLFTNFSYENICQGLFTQGNCDCDFFIAKQMGSIGYQSKCSRDAIVTMTLNLIQPISCVKNLSVTRFLTKDERYAP